MFSFAVYVLLAAVLLVVQVWAMGLTARRVGSAKSALLAVGKTVALLVGVNVACLFATWGLSMVLVPQPPAPTSGVVRASPPDFDFVGAERSQQAVSGAMAVVQLVISFVVIRMRFRLSSGRAFAPFGAYLGVSMAAYAVAVLAVQPHLVEGFVLPMPSMRPTLVSGDHVAANRTAKPKRWDIVAYHDVTARGNPIYCKRVVALPGETLTFDGHGGLLIDGKPVAAPPVVAGRYFAAPPGPAQHLARYADGEPIRLYDHEVFFIGDNVDLSYDSRFTGPSDVASIIGVVDLIYWPPYRARFVGR